MDEFLDPSDESIDGELTFVDARLALEARSWQRMNPSQRRQLLWRLADAIEARVWEPRSHLSWEEARPAEVR